MTKCLTIHFLSLSCIAWILFQFIPSSRAYYYTINNQFKNYYIPMSSPFFDDGYFTDSWLPNEKTMSNPVENNSSHDSDAGNNLNMESDTGSNYSNIYPYVVPFFPMLESFQRDYFIHSIRSFYFQELDYAHQLENTAKRLESDRTATQRKLTHQNHNSGKSKRKSKSQYPQEEKVQKEDVVHSGRQKHLHMNQVRVEIDEIKRNIRKLLNTTEIRKKLNLRYSQKEKPENEAFAEIYKWLDSNENVQKQTKHQLKLREINEDLTLSKIESSDNIASIAKVEELIENPITRDSTSLASVNHKEYATQADYDRDVESLEYENENMHKSAWNDSNNEILGKCHTKLESSSTTKHDLSIEVKIPSKVVQTVSLVELLEILQQAEAEDYKGSNIEGKDRVHPPSSNLDFLIDIIKNNDTLNSEIENKDPSKEDTSHKLSMPDNVTIGEIVDRRPKCYLVVFSHVWDSTFTDLLPQLSEVYYMHRYYLNIKRFDIIYFPLTFKEDGALLDGASRSSFGRNSVTEKMYSVLQEKFGENLPTLNFGSGSIFWMENGQYLQNWDKTIELKDFVYKGLNGQLNQFILPKNSLKFFQTTSNSLESILKFHPSILNYIGIQNIESVPSSDEINQLEWMNSEISEEEKKVIRNSSSYHVKTHMNIFFPMHSDAKTASTIERSLRHFQKYIRFRMPQDCEINIYFEDDPMIEIRIEKSIFVYNPFDTSSNEQFRDHSFIVGDLYISSKHSVFSIVQHKPQNQLITDWLQQHIQYWILPFNSFTFEEAIRARKKIVILFLDEKDTQQWKILRNRMIVYIGTVYRDNILLRNSIMFMYASYSTYLEFFDNINILDIPYNTPSIVLINHTSRVYTQCSRKCLIIWNNHWLIDHERVTEFIKKGANKFTGQPQNLFTIEDDDTQLNIQDTSEENALPHIFNVGKFHSLSSKPYNDEDIPLTTDLLEEYYTCSNETPTILFFYSQQCAHCFKFHSDIIKLITELEKNLTLSMQYNAVKEALEDEQKQSTLKLINLKAHEFYRSSLSPFTPVTIMEDNGETNTIYFQDIVKGFPSVHIVQGNIIRTYSGSYDNFILWIEECVHKFWENKYVHYKSNLKELKSLGTQENRIQFSLHETNEPTLFKGEAAQDSKPIKEQPQIAKETQYTNHFETSQRNGEKGSILVESTSCDSLGTLRSIGSRSTQFSAISSKTKDKNHDEL